jgi:hypothetical protein
VNKIEHENNKNNSLVIFGSFIIIQEILGKNINVNKIV